MGCDQRKSLLALGTLKLIVIDLFGLGLGLTQMVAYRDMHMPLYTRILLFLGTGFILVNTVLSIVLLCGSFKRHLSLLRVLFWCNIVCFVLSVLQTGQIVYYYYTWMTSFHAAWKIAIMDYNFYLSIFLFGLFNLLLQLTILILLRQEINKLGSGSSDGTELRAVESTPIRKETNEIFS